MRKFNIFSRHGRMSTDDADTAINEADEGMVVLAKTDERMDGYVVNRDGSWTKTLDDIEG